MQRSSFLRISTFGLLVSSLGLTGCGSNFTSIAGSGPIATTGVPLQGGVHGGQQPVTGSNIQLYAAGVAGYGAGSYAMLNTPVTTNSQGAFTITGDYTCPSSSSQVYIVATGGNPGAASVNPNISLMAALGPCSSLSPSTFININEVTTVANRLRVGAVHVLLLRHRRQPPPTPPDLPTPSLRSTSWPTSPPASPPDPHFLAVPPHPSRRSTRSQTFSQPASTPPAALPATRPPAAPSSPTPPHPVAPHPRTPSRPCSTSPGIPGAMSTLSSDWSLPLLPSNPPSPRPTTLPWPSSTRPAASALPPPPP